MKQGQATVTSDKAPIGLANYPIFETFDEAVVHFGGGENGTKAALAKLNAQTRTDAMNIIRSEFNTGPSKESLRKQAFQNLAVNRIAEVQAAAQQGEAAMTALLETEIARLEKEWQAERAQRLEAAKAAAAANESQAGQESNG